MIIRKENGSFVRGFCMDCKKWKRLQDHCGLKLCSICEEKFFEPLFKLYEDQEYGKDLVSDQEKKKED